MRLFDEFPQLTKEAWIAKILKDLKGKPLSVLDWDTGEGITLKPFYRQEDMAAPPPELSLRRGDTFSVYADWQTVTEIAIDDLGDALSRIQEAGENDVHAIRLYQRSSEVAEDTFQRLLSQIDFQRTAVHLYTSNGMEDIAQLFQYAEETGLEKPFLTGTLVIPASLDSPPNWAALASLIQSHAAEYPHFRLLGIDLTAIHETGGNIVQQLAYGLAMIVDAVMALEQAGLTKEQILQSLAIQFPVGGKFFLEIGKIRAFRVLYGMLLEGLGVSMEKLPPPFLIARTANWNKSVYDAHNNLCRTTTEAISAALGGAHAIIVSAFDTIAKQESVFSTRIARNIQHLLKQESSLGWVTDVAGGSYYIEQITDALGEAGWKQFLEVEQLGGYAKAFEQTAIQSAINATAAARQRKLAKRKEVLVGINQFANTNETQPTSIHPSNRRAYPYEALRQRTEALNAQRDKAIEAYLLLFGDTRMRNARAHFARNLLSAAGFHISETATPNQLETSLNDLPNRTPDMVVLCSANAAYEKEALAIMTRIRAVLPECLILIAGKSIAIEALGADACLYAGMDAPAFLTDLQNRIAQ